MRSAILLFAILTVTSAAKILVVFPGLAHSHYAIGYALAKGLAARGHDVTLVSPHEEKVPIKNLKSVLLNDVNEIGKEFSSTTNMFDAISINSVSMIYILAVFGQMISEATYADPAVQAILNGNETYDAVITESFSTDSLQGIAYRLKARSIVVATFGPSTFMNYISGAPSISSYMPQVFLGYTQRMTFCQRVHNMLVVAIEYLVNNFYHLPQQNKILHKYVPEAPSLEELIQKTSLHLFNSDPSYNGPLPLFPNMIEVGGFHVDPPKKLPEDLQKYLDKSKNGVIIFSMGSNLKSKDLPEKTRDSILRVFSKLKENILWKFEEDLPDKPKNVEIRSWLPQRDILAHPNIKLFISHGGLLGTTEGIYSGVPIVGIPVFGDQALNMQIATNRGFGISVPYEEFTEEKFSSALKEMLSNPTYSQKAKEISTQIKDKELAPLDKATYWVEYVIRHKGADHLKTAANELTWYQYHSLDVILFLVLVTVVLLKLFWIVIKKLICRKKKTNIEKKKRH